MKISEDFMYRVSVLKSGAFLAIYKVRADNALSAIEETEKIIKKPENSFCYEFIAKRIED